MAAGTTTYRPARRDVDPGALATALVESGFDLTGPEPVTRTVLDTFDGRLAAAELRLEYTQPTHSRRAARGELVLHGGPGAPAQMTVSAAPSVAADLPAGPLRSRLSRLLDVRVLLPLLSVTSERTVALKRNGTGKVTAIAAIHENGRAADVPLEAASLVEAVELVGYPKAGDELRDLVEALGFVEADSDLVDLAAGAAGVDLRGVSIGPGIPLDAATPAADGFQSVLANLRDAIFSTWDGTIDDTDPEFLHDLRVAVRRTRSVLANAKRVIPDDVRDQARDDFGWLGQLTGPARDLDVYQIEWSGYVSQLGASATDALEPVRIHLESRREAEHVNLSAGLAAGRARRIIDEWSAWLDGSDPGADASPTAPTRPSGEPPPDADRPIGTLIAKRVRQAHQTMIGRGRTIDTGTPAEVLHELRKDAKKLRYLLECFGGLYDGSARKAFVQRLKALQDNLGEHQDAEVHVHQLRELSATLASVSTTDTTLATGQLIERMEQRRITCREEFAERFDEFDSKKTAKALDDLLAGPAVSS